MNITLDDWRKVMKDNIYFFFGKFQKNGKDYESCYDRLVAEKVDRMF